MRPRTLFAVPTIGDPVKRRHYIDVSPELRELTSALRAHGDGSAVLRSAPALRATSLARYGSAHRYGRAVPVRPGNLLKPWHGML